MRLAWLTDLHLNFLDRAALEAFGDALRDCDADAFLVGGDLGEADSVCEYLAWLDDLLDRSIYFVLGNHDFYRASIRGVRARVAALCRERENLVYLTDAEVIELSENAALVGCDGWGDARAGNFDDSEVMLNDYLLIDEVSLLTKSERRTALESLGNQAANHVQQVLPQAVSRHQQTILLTHVPPLREACWHEGQLSDDDWAPHFTCLAAGEAILEVMSAHPDRQLTVLCGHTHSPGECQPAENVRILTGKAVYGSPQVQRVIEV
jgi:predicted phosphohydrolase